ncbi:MAG: hypothetical protein ABI771_07330 [Betaproteobacteria bacterium]
MRSALSIVSGTALAFGLPLMALATGTTTTSVSSSHSMGATNSNYMWSILFIGPTTIQIGDFGICKLQSPPFMGCSFVTGTGTPADPFTYSCTSALTLTGCSLPGTPDNLLAGQRNVNTHTHSLLAGSLDVDASITASQYDALTDGLLIIRYLFGLTGTSLTTGALGGTATRTGQTAILGYLDGIRSSIDIDGNGSSDALTDGLLLLRYMFGLRGNALIANAVDPLGTRTTAVDIEAYIQSLMPQ